MPNPFYRYPLLSVTCAIALSHPQVAAARPNCSSHADVRQVLADRFGETQQRVGTNQAGQIVEIYASFQTGSWTLVITIPEGVSCLAASGHNYASDFAVAQPFETASN